MSSQFKNFTLAAAALAVAGYLVGCGTAGNNTGFRESGGGLAQLGGGATAAAAAGTAATGTTGGLTGGATGNATANPTLPATVATGLTLSNMLSTTGPAGSTNSPTRLGLINLGGTLGTRPVVAQGNKLGVGQSFVALLSRNPEGTPGTSTVRLVPSAGTFIPPANNLQNIFGLTVDGTNIYITNQFLAALQGSVIRISNIQNNGNAQFDLMGTANLQNPIDVVVEGSFIYVAEYETRGGGGQIRRINTTNGTTDILIQNVNFPSSLVMDTSNGRRLLYIAENGNNSGSGAQGGIARVDLAAFTAGQPLTAGGVGNTPNPGVTFMGTGTETAFVNPFDLAVDDVGNVVISEGVTYTGGVFTPSNNQGRIRVIPRTPAGGTLPTNARIILSGLGGTRGVSILREDAAGDANTVFFTEGIATQTTLRQVTFRNTDAAIFRHLQLDNGKINPLDTLFDAGAAGPPVVAPNVKYTVQFDGSNQGQVIDVR